MKLLLVSITAIVVGIALNAYLEALHYNLYNQRYETCKQQLIASNNYKTQQQAFNCVENSIGIKILGTILFREGSILR